jgi:hypothetical protein
MAGLGYVKPPDPGNSANAPAPAPVQTGGYQFIQPAMFGAGGDNQSIVNVPSVPPAYRDSGAYAMNSYGLSGLTGGGSTGEVPDVDNGPVLYYDEISGLYINIGG